MGLTFEKKEVGACCTNCAWIGETMASECLDILGSSFSNAYECDAKIIKVKKKCIPCFFLLIKKLIAKYLQGGQLTKSLNIEQSEKQDNFSELI